MNKKIEGNYIKKVQASLPVYGNNEKAYIKKLEDHLQNYCDEYPDVTEEDIVKEFGTPTSVVSDYFCEIDEDYLFRKLRIRNHVRISIFVITASIIILNIFCGYFYYKEYQATRNSTITKEETITIIKEER